MLTCELACDDIDCGLAGLPVSLASMTHAQVGDSFADVALDRQAAAREAVVAIGAAQCLWRLR
jgi:hypothetical protein